MSEMLRSRGSATLVGVLALLVSGLAAAQSESHTVTVGEEEIRYDSVRNVDTDFDGKTDGISYYRAGRLVASAFDNDGDGRHDLWLAYDESLRLDLEVVDRDHDGRADVSRKISANETVVSETDLSPSLLSATSPLRDWRVLAVLGAVAVFGVMATALGALLLFRRRPR